MSCERHTSAIVDHACGAEIAAEAAAHLSVCEGCRAMFDEQRRLLQDLDQELKQALEIEPSTRFVPDVLARVERSAFRRRRMLWWSPAAAAAVLVLVAFGSLQFGERRAAERQNPAAAATGLAGVPCEPHAVGGCAAGQSSGGPPDRDAPPASITRTAASGGPAGVEIDVAAPAAQSRAIARYLDSRAPRRARCVSPRQRWRHRRRGSHRARHRAALGRRAYRVGGSQWHRSRR